MVGRMLEAARMLARETLCRDRVIPGGKGFYAHATAVSYTRFAAAGSSAEAVPVLDSPESLCQHER